MSLFGSIQMGGNTLRAMQIGLQVVGNNIANANTPGYIRQEAVYSPAPVQRQGKLILGLGVEVDSIVQKLDRFVQERLVGARSDRAAAETQEKAYRDLEVMLNELSSDGDLSSGMTAFFNSIHEIMTDPGSVAARSQAVGNGVTLTQRIADLNSRVFTIQEQLNERVSSMSDEINDLAEEIRKLNLQIVSIEGGDPSSSSAGSLRVRRQNAVDSLAELIGVHVEEQPSGGISVSVGGEFLVFEGQRRAVEVDTSSEDSEGRGILQFVDSQSALATNSGELQGLYAARDVIVDGFLNGLDQLAGTLAFEFNKVYSQGQGLVGFSTLTSTEAVHDADTALDAAGLSFTPVNGAFDVLIHSKEDNLTKTHTIRVDLNGLDDDTSLNDLAAELDAIEGLSASVTSSGALVLSRKSTDIEFAFAGDTSGALAALGLNTFFTGSTAGTLGVNENLKGTANATKFAASSGGIGEDAQNAERLAAFLDQPLESAGNASLIDLYNQLLNEVTQGSAASKSVAEGFRVFEGTLDGQAQAVSGVSLDEEAIKMITLQRIFQASARYIQTISELMDYLVKL
jgi:flagellar hook-associated protein 1 FlgK